MSKEVATCLDQKMQAKGFHSRGIFVGDAQLTTEYFGDGHAIVLVRTLWHRLFKALPMGYKAYLQIVYWPAAP